MRRVTVFGLVVALAGCLSGPDATCTDAACDGSPDPTEPFMVDPSPGYPFPGLPQDAWLRSVQLEGCTGLSGGLSIPQDWVRAELPPEFRGISVFPGTYRVVISALDCDRVVLPSAILERASLLTLSAAVVPVNESWEPVVGGSDYVFDFYASSPVLADQFVAWGFSAKAATFEFGQLPLLGDASRTWRVTSGDESVSFSYRLDGNQTRENSATNYYWTGQDAFRRASGQVEYAFDTEYQPGQVEFAGPSKTARIARTPSAAWDGSPLARLDWTMTIDLDEFYGR